MNSNEVDHGSRHVVITYLTPSLLSVLSCEKKEKKRLIKKIGFPLSVLNHFQSLCSNLVTGVFLRFRQNALFYFGFCESFNVFTFF